MTPVWLAFAAAMIAAAAIDFDHRIIPDEISLGGLLVALAAVPAAQWADGTPYWSALQRSAFGALLGAGALWVVGFAHARVATALGRSFDHWPGEGEVLPRPASLDYWTWFPGVGFGDVKLLALIGAVIGPLGVLEAILAASLAGLLLGIAWAAVTRQWNAPFGFAPALAVGALLVVLSPVHLIP
jgi:leader peptidase (prepilin peptidase)/N-methyltransferase